MCPYAGNGTPEPARIRPVHGNRPFDDPVRYVVRQPIKHGVNGDPALWGGSCFVDLVGARDANALAARVRLALEEAVHAAGLMRSGGR